MAINNSIVQSVLALSLPVAPVAAGMTRFTTLASAKGDNGGGNGGGGNGGGNGGGHGGGSGKSSSGNTGERGKSSQKAQRTSKVSITENAAKTPGLRSLNRNYHAYLNSNNPRMTAAAAYAQAYAEFKTANGVDEIPTGRELSYEALREALAGFTKDGIVTDATLNEAKSILGVGAEVGKIDQIRESLASDESDLESTELRHATTVHLRLSQLFTRVAGG